MRPTFLASLLVFAVALSPVQGWAATKAEAEATATPRLATARALGRGLVKGVRHTAHAIRPLARGTRDASGELLSTRARWMRPVKYGAMVGGIFAVGAAAKAVHVDPEPFMLGLSGLAYAYQLKTRALPILRGTRGTARVEALAAEVVYPGLLVLGSGTGGIALGHGESAGILQAGAQSAVIGFDVPTIVQGAADHDDLGQGGGGHSSR